MSSWVSHGAELVVRSVALPFVLGFRWLGEHGEGAGAAPDATGHGWARRLKVAADELFFASELLAGGPSAFFDIARLRAEMHASVTFFRARGWLDDPAAYHPMPPPLHDTALVDLVERGGSYQHLRFESGYAPAEGEPGRER